MPDWIAVRTPDGERTLSGRAPIDPATTDALVRAARLVRRQPSRAGVKPRSSVYVVLLEYGPKEYRLYVGSTGLTPEERYAKHKAGHRASRRVTRLGIGLLPALYRHLNPLDAEHAEATEVELAEALRTTGLRVHQG